MARWSEVEEQAPELATLAKAFLDAHVHKTLATNRRDGSPRISGTEIRFIDGELYFGSMLNAVKARDLLRDSRFAIHSGSTDPPHWEGDAKLAGRVEEITDPGRIPAINGAERASRSHLFRADITELVVVRLVRDPTNYLDIAAWHPDRGVTRVQR
ncbi:MAG: pyridoxamine 5'-phosphate oxidase family protein [Solirubrobacteraceae bacterium]|nr:MAG: pyridoxamine 5'-phosphate oxidase [Solirubrobacterales bacterium]